MELLAIACVVGWCTWVQVDGSGFFVKVASGMVPGEVVDLISEGGKHYFRTFQKELVIIGVKIFANGPVATIGNIQYFSQMSVLQRNLL